MEHSCIDLEMATVDQETLLSQKEKREPKFNTVTFRRPIYHVVMC